MDRRPEILQALRTQLRAAGVVAAQRIGISTGLPLFDAFASPDGSGLALGAIHEILADPDLETAGDSAGTLQVFIASALIAGRQGGWVVWSDPGETLYPPALVKAGLEVERLLILRPRSPQEELWAIAECMRCRGVAATVARIGKLTPVQARRLQLAAEQGGGVGVLVRPDDARSSNYAAATRWRVTALPATSASHQTSQRWNVELVYGHGGRVGQRLVLEVDRETRRVGVGAAVVPGAAVARAAADDSVHRADHVADGSRAAS